MKKAPSVAGGAGDLRCGTKPSAQQFSPARTGRCKAAYGPLGCAWPKISESQARLEPMIEVTPDITLNDDEVQERFIRAAGPGGQNVKNVRPIKSPGIEA